MNLVPRFPLAHLPTPLERMARLSEALGGPEIWIKRDDHTGLATGGNKTRKLELLVGEALAQGAQVLLTVGAIQSKVPTSYHGVMENTENREILT